MSFAVEPYGEPAFSALRAIIDEAKKTDPLSPVTVIAPSNYTGLSLRRRLGKAGSVVNIRFLVLARVAELLGSARLALAKRPLTAWNRAEAVRAVLVGHRGVLESVSEHPATESALSASFRDLRLASVAALNQMAASSDKNAQLIALYRRFRELTADTYDVEDLAESAAEAVRDGSAALQDLGRLLLYLPRSLSPAQTALIREFMSRDAIDIVLGQAFDQGADQVAIDLAERLEIKAPESWDPGEPPTATDILRTIDTEEEVRGVIRLSLDAASGGTPFYRIGILFGSSDLYAPLLQEQLRAAEIPFNGPPARPLADSLVGRLLIGMLRLPDTRFRRDAVMDWLTSGPIVETTEGPYAGRWVPAHQWDQISRDAGVVGGSGQFRQRLQIWGVRDGQQRNEAASAARLAAFIEELERRLKPPAGASIRDMVRWGLGLLDRFLGSENAAAGWENDAELEAYQEVRRRLESVANAESLWQRKSSRLPSPPSLDLDGSRQLLARLIEDSLQDASGRLGRFGDGIFIGSLKNARGMDFDRVFVLGMVEGSMPGPSREDPLIPDRERERFLLPARAASRLELRCDYLAALASSSQRTLCFAESSLRSQSKQTPSRWLLESASSLQGDLISSDDLEQLGSAPWLTSLASFQQALTTTSLAAGSRQEWEVRSLLGSPNPRDHFLGQEPAFLASLYAATSRLAPWSRRIKLDAAELWRRSGAVGGGLGLGSKRPYSPTSLETLATCPFRYFLGQVGRVRETMRPEEIVRISGADRGNIIHDSLERFFSDTKMHGRSLEPDEPWQDDDAERLNAIADEECDRAHERGITGGELFWQVDRARIKRDLRAFLIADTRVRTETGARFLEAEHSFGDLDRDGDRQTESWEAVVVRLDRDRELAFRGRIDRVDKAEDGTLIVYDYKSGSGRSIKETAKSADRLAGGRLLQLPIYALAARAALGEGSAAVRAYYWLTSEREQFAQVGYELEQEDEAALSETLGVLANLVESGEFPPVPGDSQFNPQRQRQSYENCRYCPYDRVCPAGNRVLAWEERKEASGLSDYVALSEREPEAQEDEVDADGAGRA